jgi:SRSO17 transposase
MGRRRAEGSEERFAAYVEELASVIGHADRVPPLEAYCIGLMLPCERKSVEPMAAITAPERVSAQHQSMLHFIGQGAWSDEAVLSKVREIVVPEMARHGPIEAWIIDDTGFPKQGKHSVGVARQYCGRLGKQDNCQVAVMLSLANHHASLPVAYRLYLPKDWANDEARCCKAGVPNDIGFMTKPEIALEQIRWAHEVGLPPGVVLMDAGYGASTELRSSIAALGLTYVAGILPNTTVWEKGEEPLPPKQYSGRGRAAKVMRRDAEHQPIPVKGVALNLPASAWRKVSWREGAAGPLSSRFARVRVRVAHRDYERSDSRPEEWLLIERSKGEKEPTKYWLSTLPEGISLRRLVDHAKLRWRIEHDYLELKQEAGLGDFEGRGWRGFHHHATMSIAVYGFLVSERGAFPPSAAIAKVLFPQFALPEGYRPRGSAAAA